MNRRNLRRWLWGTSAALIAFIGISWIAGSMLLAPVNHPLGSPPDDLPMESIRIPSLSGSSIAAWHLPCEGATSTVLLLHGIRANRRSMLARAKVLNKAGYATLLIDFQAHGESPGEYITAGYLERLDVDAAVGFIRSRNPDHKIGVVGCSMGGVATLLASPIEIDALVLESVFPTVAEAVHNRIALRLGPLHHVLAPALLVQLPLRLGISPSQIRPIDKVADVECPVLVASGDLDLHTTLEETQRLYNAAHDPKKLVVFKGATHTDLMHHNPKQYQSEVIDFLDTHLRATQPTPFK